MSRWLSALLDSRAVMVGATCEQVTRMWFAIATHFRRLQEGGLETLRSVALKSFHASNLSGLHPQNRIEPSAVPLRDIDPEEVGRVSPALCIIDVFDRVVLVSDSYACHVSIVEEGCDRVDRKPGGPYR